MPSFCGPLVAPTRHLQVRRALSETACALLHWDDGLRYCVAAILRRVLIAEKALFEAFGVKKVDSMASEPTPGLLSQADSGSSGWAPGIVCHFFVRWGTDSARCGLGNFVPCWPLNSVS